MRRSSSSGTSTSTSKRTRIDLTRSVHRTAYTRDIVTSALEAESKVASNGTYHTRINDHPVASLRLTHRAESGPRKHISSSQVHQHRYLRGLQRRISSSFFSCADSSAASGPPYDALLVALSSSSLCMEAGMCMSGQVEIWRFRHRRLSMALDTAWQELKVV
ncbi:hypothetical protein IE81DRAFT_124903 [Ceraceosorus guamensis]|uniref:Uncharacterized protein n=1 Tax=Ceraceosorus guamensis TaxID=1522189 RepID=A0A316VXW5_9BASI|nr:hypothetical protein IE81DRAFT_124903 [Ceraceosorus guamensis]PWN42497.1 hypothetical protein IE81DRAFT_124903 [Ceraceosorus guamensis]